jgi:AcrR family transcriptional regulator
MADQTVPGSGGGAVALALPPESVSRPTGEEGKSTRERILDVALDLFTEQGYEQTSLREIAEKLGVTKAALYYHFASKDKIFLALHERLHAIGVDNVWALGEGPTTLEAWSELLDDFIEQIPENRQLILMHDRNRAAFEKIHMEGHAQEHQNLEEGLRAALSDATIPSRDRIRMSCAFSAVLGGLMFGTGDVLLEITPDVLVRELKAVVADLLRRDSLPGLDA